MDDSIVSESDDTLNDDSFNCGDNYQSKSKKTVMGKSGNLVETTNSNDKSSKLTATEDNPKKTYNFEESSEQIVYTTDDLNDFSEIQNNIANYNGGTVNAKIVLSSGEYNYPSTFTSNLLYLNNYNKIKNIVLEGNNAIIDCTSSTNTLFKISSGYNLKINNLTLKNYNVSSNLPLIYNNGNITINAVITDNITINSAGTSTLYSYLGTVVINNSLIKNNTINGIGGAIYANDNYHLNITNSIFLGNTGIKGIIHAENSNVMVNNSKFDENINSYYRESGGNIVHAGAIYLEGSSSSIYDSNFTRNKACDGAGIYSIGGILNVFGCNFDSNIAYDYETKGAALLSWTNTLNVKKSNFTNNKRLGTKQYGGGAIGIVSNSNALIENCLMDNNSAYNGGAVYVDNATLKLKNSLLSNNKATYGGGLMTFAQASNFHDYVDIINTTFVNNTASQYGGALDARYVTMNVLNCTFEKNSATQLQAHLLFSYVPSTLVNINNSIIRETEGYIFYNANGATLNLNYNNITDNKCSRIIENQATANLNYNNITYNTISDNVFYLNGVTILSHNNITNNNVNQIFYLLNMATLSYNNISNNKVDNLLLYVHTTAQTIKLSYNNITNNNAPYLMYILKEAIFSYNNITNNIANIILYNRAKTTLSYNNITNNKVISNYYVIYNTGTINIDNNVFVNNTNNVRDMLLNSNSGTFNVAKNNVYVDNYLEDYWDVTTDTVDVISNEEKRIHVINLRNVYNNVIVNGTIICYLKGSTEVFDTFDVENGDALIKLTESPSLGLGEHIFELEYQSLSKHYQNLRGAALRVELKINLKPEPVNVTKVWRDDDSSNRQEITINLYKNGVFNQTALLNDANDWKYSFNDLSKFDDEGNLIKYTIDEPTVPEGYIKSITNNTPYNFTVTNIKTINININQIWDDNNNQDGIRPTSVSVNLIADGVVINNTVLNEDNLWKHTFKNLPKFKEDGNLIKYAFTEADVPGYSWTVTNNNYEFTLTNTHGTSQAKIRYVVINDIEGKVAIDIRVYDENDDEIPNSKLNITIDDETTSTIIKTNIIYQNTTLNPGEHTINVKYLGTQFYSETNKVIHFTVVTDPNSLKTNITELENKIKGLNILRTNIITLKEAIKNLNGQMTILNNKIIILNSTIQNQNTKLNQSIQELKQQINNLINNNLTQLQKNIAILENKINDLEKLQTDIINLEIKIKELEALQTNVTTLNETIQKLNGEITILNNKINLLNSTIQNQSVTNIYITILQQNNPSSAKTNTKTTLTLKTVKKLSKKAKKLKLQATLKINGKKAKGKKVTFIIRGKKFKKKTNKKGVAKLTIKKAKLKKLLKKAKVGKKIVIKVKYGKTLRKKYIKIKK